MVFVNRWIETDSLKVTRRRFQMETALIEKTVNAVFTLTAAGSVLPIRKILPRPAFSNS